MKFDIEGRLPGLNEMIDAAKSHFGAYAKMKHTYTDMVAWLAKMLIIHQLFQVIPERKSPSTRYVGEKP